MNPVHPSPAATADHPDSSLESVASNGGGRFTKLVSEIGKKLSRRNDKDTLVEKNILKESSVSPTIVQKKLSFEKERQQDALNRKLEMRPSKVDLKLRNILKPGDSNDSLFRPDDQNPLDFEAKAVKLKSILKRRPSRVELEEMNIIQAPYLAPNLADTQRRLSRSMIEDSLESKLRTRPSVHELEAKNIVFCETVEVLTTFRKSEYNRKPDGDVTFKHLTPQLKVAIRNELNTYKKTEMQIHEEFVGLCAILKLKIKITVGKTAAAVNLRSAAVLVEATCNLPDIEAARNLYTVCGGVTWIQRCYTEQMRNLEIPIDCDYFSVRIPAAGMSSNLTPEFDSQNL